MSLNSCTPQEVTKLIFETCSYLRILFLTKLATTKYHVCAWDVALGIELINFVVQ